MDVRFLVFLTVRVYLTFLKTNITMYSLMHKELKFFGISRLSAVVFDIKAITFCYF
jgi:hypothetical protein